MFVFVINQTFFFARVSTAVAKVAPKTAPKMNSRVVMLPLPLALVFARFLFDLFMTAPLEVVPMLVSSSTFEEGEEAVTTPGPAMFLEALAFTDVG